MEISCMVGRANILIIVSSMGNFVQHSEPFYELRDSLVHLRWSSWVGRGVFPLRKHCYGCRAGFSIPAFHAHCLDSGDRKSVTAQVRKSRRRKKCHLEIVPFQWLWLTASEIYFFCYYLVDLERKECQNFQKLGFVQRHYVQLNWE